MIFSLIQNISETEQEKNLKSQLFRSFLNRVPCVPAWSTCPHANVPTCQKRANFSRSINVPKLCQLFNLACQKALQFFNYFSKEFLILNFSIILNIWKFISQNKEFKFWHLQIFIKEKPYQHKTFNVVFSRARGINRTISRLV